MNEIEAIEELKNNIGRFWETDMYDALELAISALEAQQWDRWIPVTEKPPVVQDGEWGAFIVPSYFGTGTFMMTSRYFIDNGISHKPGWADKEVGRATYWMPLGSCKEGE